MRKASFFFLNLPNQLPLYLLALLAFPMQLMTALDCPNHHSKGLVKEFIPLAL
jgi:hypothetical protein